MDNLLRLDGFDWFKPDGFITPHEHSDNQIGENIQKDPFADMYQNFTNQLSKPSDDVVYGSRSFDWERNNVDRYTNSPYYKELGYDDRNDNESRYGYQQTLGNTIGNAFGGAWRLGVNGFIDGWKGWGRMSDALLHLDWSKLAGDPESLKILNDNQNKIMNDNAIFDTPESKATFWNRKTFGNFLQQSGFTLGTLAQTVTEQLLTKAIEALIAIPTMGAGSAALEGIEDAATLAKVSSMAQLTKAITLEKTAKGLFQTGADLWKDEKATSNLLNVIAGKIPFGDVITDMKLAKNWGASAGTIAMVGAGSIKRGLSELNLAMTEARMEAAGTYGGMHNQLYYDYLDKNGVAPSGKELEKIENASYSAGKDNFLFNSTLLTAMNRIQFDNMFKSFKLGSKVSDLIGEEEETHLMKNAVEVTGKMGERTTTQYYQKGLLGTIGTLGSVAKDFGNKEAAYLVGKTALKHLTKWEVAEGVQELLQNGSNDYFTDYYTDLYHGVPINREKSLNKAIDQEWSMEGLKTFMSGALTGMLTSAPSKLVEKTFEHIATTKQERKDAHASVDSYIKEANAFFKSPLEVLSQINKNFNIQGETSNTLDKALQNKDKFHFENFRATSLGALSARAVRMDAQDAIIQTLRDYGTHISKEDFEKAFIGEGYTDKTKTATGDYTNKIADAIQSYSDTYTHLHEKLDKRVNPAIFPENSREYKEACFIKTAQDDLIETLAGNKQKAQNAYERLSKIYTQVASDPKLGQSLGSAFMTLGSKANLQSELAALKNDISTLEKLPEKDRDLNKSLIEKKKQLEALSAFHEHNEKYYDLIEDEDSNKFIVHDEKKVVHSIHDTKESANKTIDTLHKESVNKLKEGFVDYINAKNKENNITTQVTNDEYDAHFERLNDYIRLNDNSKRFIDAYNMLSNPKNFSQLQNRLHIGARHAYLNFQLNMVDHMNNYRGFVAANPELLRKIDELRKKDNLSEEDTTEFHNLLEEIIKKAYVYKSDPENEKQYLDKIGDIIDNDLEFRHQYQQQIDKFTVLSEYLEKLSKTDDIYPEKQKEFNELRDFLINKAEEFIKTHEIKTEESTTTNNTGTNVAETNSGESTGNSEKGTSTESKVITTSDEKQKNSKDDIINTQITEINKAEDITHIEQLEKKIHESIANPESALYGISLEQIKKLEDIIAKRKEELPTFAKLNLYDIITYNTNNIIKEYKVIKITNNEVHVIDMDKSKANEKIILSSEDVNKYGKITNPSNFVPKKEIKITPEEVTKMKESIETNENFHENAAAKIQEEKRVDKLSFKDVDDEFINGIGC